MKKTQSLEKSLFVLALVMFVGDASALTRGECEKRVVTAMQNAKALGGGQEQEERMGAFAANECMKEMRASQSDSSADTPMGDKAGFDATSMAIPAVILALLGYFLVWPLVSGYLRGSKAPVTPIGSPASNLFDNLGDNIKNMTVDEIAQATESSRRMVIAWLTRRGNICKDFDGLEAQKRLDVR